MEATRRCGLSRCTRDRIEGKGFARISNPRLKGADCKSAPAAASFIHIRGSLGRKQHVGADCPG